MPNEPQVIISMAEWRAYERFHEQVDELERAIEQGKLEGKLQGYELVRSHLTNPALTQLRAPGLVESLERIIATCRADLDRLRQAPSDEPGYRLTEKAVRHVELKCPLAPGHDGPCMGEQIVGQAVGGPAPVITPSSRGA